MDKTNGITRETPASPAANDLTRADKASSSSRFRFVSLLDAPSAPGKPRTREPLALEDVGAAELGANGATALPSAPATPPPKAPLPLAQNEGGNDDGGTLDIARRISASAEALASLSGVAAQSAQRVQGRSPVQDDLTSLLQRYCSDMYVADARAGSGRMLLGLDAAFPGAAAEFVRDGAFLRVRLHVRDEDVFRKIDAERERLRAALDKSTPLQVSVDVVWQGSARPDPI